MDEASFDSNEESSGTLRKLLIGAGSAVAIGVAVEVARRAMQEDKPFTSDAPVTTARNGYTTGADGSLFSKTVTINRPRSEVYGYYRQFTNLPRFMDNVRNVEVVDEVRTRWTIEAPAGSTVTFDSLVIQDEQDRLIVWESDPASGIVNKGRIEFSDDTAGRGTRVRAIIDYHPPAGAIGKTVAKLFQREPKIQARRDLRRFKQLMETGEVAVNTPGQRGPLGSH